MLGAARNSPAQLASLDRIAGWTRARFALPPEAAVLVSETACPLPGCPPLETVVAFWTLDATRHHFKLFKPAQAVLEDDLPYAWLMKSLAVPEGFADDCC
jgi:hypothetical protein